MFKRSVSTAVFTNCCLPGNFPSQLLKTAMLRRHESDNEFQHAHKSKEQTVNETNHNKSKSQQESIRVNDLIRMINLFHVTRAE